MATPCSAHAASILDVDLIAGPSQHVVRSYGRGVRIRILDGPDDAVGLLSAVHLETAVDACDKNRTSPALVRIIERPVTRMSDSMPLKTRKRLPYFLLSRQLRVLVGNLFLAQSASIVGR